MQTCDNMNLNSQLLLHMRAFLPSCIWRHMCCLLVVSVPELVPQMCGRCGVLLLFNFVT